MTRADSPTVYLVYSSNRPVGLSLSDFRKACALVEISDAYRRSVLILRYGAGRPTVFVSFISDGQHTKHHGQTIAGRRATVNRKRGGDNLC
jgi:hypothetical protein